MSGIDKLKEHLDSDCRAQCDKIIGDANARAEAVIEDAKKQGGIKSEEILRTAEKKADDIVRLANSSADMAKKQALLSAKVKLLNSVIEDAVSSLCSMTEDEYASVVIELTARNAQSGEGVLLVSEADENIITEDILAKINALISDRGKLSLSVSPELKEKGVVLVYGDIEINLTFVSIARAKEDELKQEAQNILFKQKG